MRQTITGLAAVAAALLVLMSATASPSAQTSKPRPEPIAGAPATKSGTTVNINTATAEQLEALPGVGAKTAARIIDYRQKKGPFKKIEELMNVQGIGEKSFLKLKPQVTVGGNAP